MRLAVRHTTLYQFGMPMRFVVQSHRLTPVSHAGQEVLDWTVAAEGAVFGAGFVDGAGDAVTTMTVQGPVERIEVEVEGTVETRDTAGVLRGQKETVSPRVYLRPTRGDPAEPGARSSSRDAALAGAPGDDLGRAHALAAAVVGGDRLRGRARPRRRPRPPRRSSSGAGSARTWRTR